MSELYIPNLAARRFEDIDFDQVLNEKRRFLCVDLDNTLLPQTGFDISRLVVEKLDALRESGQVEDICLISNVIIPGPRVKRLYELAQRLAIRHVVPCYFFNRKPKSSPFRKALSLMKAQPEECVMVGDQIFSDILGGNRLGLYTIWLEPMSPDSWSTRLVGKRLREKKVIKRMRERGLLDYQT